MLLGPDQSSGNYQKLLDTALPTVGTVHRQDVPLHHAFGGGACRHVHSRGADVRGDRCRVSEGSRTSKTNCFGGVPSCLQGASRGAEGDKKSGCRLPLPTVLYFGGVERKKFEKATRRTNPSAVKLACAGCFGLGSLTLSANKAVGSRQLRNLFVLR